MRSALVSLRSVLVCTLVFALTTGSAAAVGTKPLRTELTILPGASATSKLTVINEQDTPMTVKPELEVLLRNDEKGFPVVADNLPANDPLNISSWVRFSSPQLSLKGRESKDVNVTITVPKNAEPGGHYASVVWVPTVSDTSAVKVESRVASLLLITVAGKTTTAGSIKSFAPADPLQGDGPLSFNVEFQNEGNIHVKPTGYITLKDDKGTVLTKVARYTDPKTSTEVVADTIPFNLVEGNILPNSVRIFRCDWTDNIKPGKYTADLTVNYGGEAPLTAETTVSFDEKVQVKNFSLNDKGASGADFVLSLQNSGTVQEKPVGSIAIANAFGTKVADVVLPKDLAYVAPGETKDLTIPWMTTPLPEGGYVAHLVGTYGFGKTAMDETTKFGQAALVITMPMLLTGIGVLVVAGGVWYGMGRKKKHSHRKPRTTEE